MGDSGSKECDQQHKENFATSIAEVEPYLMGEAGSTIYKKSIRRITTASKSFGMICRRILLKLPNAWRIREKQNAFIQQKEEERKEAEAAAVEASAEESEVEANAEEVVEEKELLTA